MSRTRQRWVRRLAGGSSFYHRRLHVERLEDRRLLAAGDLDPTFDGDGIVTTAIGSGGYAWDLAVQADGKIVVAGTGANDFALARYNTNGSLDTSFSGDGKLTTFIGPMGDIVFGVAIQADGKIVVAGESHNGSNLDFALARYNADGTLDTSFSGDGKLTTAIGSSNDHAWSVAIQADGKIVVAGESYNGSNYDFALARYNANGTLDTSFSGDGKLTTAIGSSNDQGFGVVIQADGKIVATGTATISGVSNIAMVRYNANGSLDSSFGGDGIVTTPIGSGGWGRNLALAADGKIVVAVHSYNGSNYDFALARYNANGSLDTSFSGDGKVTTEIGSSNDYGIDLAIQADGKIVVAGRTHNVSNTDIAVVRYNADGTLDTSFSGDGKLTTAIDSSSNVEGVAIQADGKIVVAGYAVLGSASNFAVARYEGNTSPTNPAGVALAAINEDVADGSNTGTLVSAIVTASGSSDLDGNTLGIAVTAVDNANGQWQYSTNGGGSWQSLSGAGAASARLLAPAHRVRFVPNLDFNSSVGPAPTIGFKVWDQTTGAAGATADTTIGSAFSASAAQATQPVTSINDEQVLTTNLTLEEVGLGAGGIITTSLLLTTDVDDAPAELVYTIISGPSYGSVRVSGTPATQFTQQQLNDGLVSYDHDSTENFTDGFRFTVDDGEGTVSLGTFSITIVFPGDYNRNGIVDAPDYVLWRKTLGATGVREFSGADGNGDGTIDQDDYDVWTLNFGDTLPTPGAGGGDGGVARSHPEGTRRGASGEGRAESVASSSALSPPDVSGPRQAESDLGAGDLRAAVVRGRPSTTLRRAETRAQQSAALVSDDALIAWLSSRVTNAGAGELATSDLLDESFEPEVDGGDDALDDVFASLSI